MATGVCEKTHSFYSSLGHATQQQKLQSGPRFGAFEAEFPTSLLILRSVFFTNTGTRRPSGRCAPKCLSLWGPLGDTPSIRNMLFQGPVKPPRGQTPRSPRPKVTSVRTRRSLPEEDGARAGEGAEVHLPRGPFASGARV